ncbi:MULTISPECIES: GlsB/YeaQ/YmgE family stress response membrane protein [Corynebacterium]|uniref:GlsB/YeaQ/YmgE family stress response membrane protein n=6 Tax=Corynebacterium TaxID=1716 RepID=A0A6I3KBT8_9CORY|nr:MULTISPECIES: GlsB/YeaQ/YmgE family stress response membrane protein [Corynebacterium]KKO80725.1 membrane protein [Corynebacterium minutissimum]ACP34014.1 putative membrane protein [Corynebacterium aurimucosum ATCC 700975]MBE7339383.1 GlsB/YeaQ/YmgE family stress response membrane protein [Corynebacterium aurimucosum]MCG7261576.1 GlsB/YeaQ/YmgE family stress response membrane protein [Corynebacterium aurimucosum]MDK6806472.1 GlsB/YeaQ/YmgE family stress response membrane protein [Corynebact
MGLGLGFFGSIVVGIIAGWLAEKIMKRDQGLFTNLIVGVIGGLIGGGLLALFNKSVGDSWFLMIITATVGACILLWIVGAITGRKK